MSPAMTDPFPRRAPQEVIARLAHHLWPQGAPYGGPERDGRALYMIVDAARDPGLYPGLLAREEETEMRALYQGDTASDLAEVAPYLVQLPRGSAVADWLVGEGWGRGWGVLLQADGDIDAVRRHLRKFTIVNDGKGTTYLFRFYDPVVLGSFLPISDAAQRAALFGPGIRFLVEDAGADALVLFEAVDGDLRRVEVPLGAVAGADPAAAR
ncbi:DUF4123 domain-containing protein [Azospirillum sp. YIM B02556]|uniref:DUF4123 domain-containing protein n=2 Tax=Azospirillum endophyticum TaxID=2800326 RepID=A0ABS1F6P6_9PROT|nr:DUF4123 domain-containing protein [Azospirillum endophyticum]